MKSRKIFMLIAIGLLGAAFTATAGETAACQGKAVVKEKCGPKGHCKTWGRKAHCAKKLNPELVKYLQEKYPAETKEIDDLRKRLQETRKQIWEKAKALKQKAEKEMSAADKAKFFKPKHVNKFMVYAREKYPEEAKAVDAAGKAAWEKRKALIEKVKAEMPKDWKPAGCPVKGKVPETKKAEKTD